MRVFLTIVILVVFAVLLTIPWSLAMDLALYAALSQELSDRSMRIATEAIDKTELPRAISLVFVLVAWGGIVLLIDRVMTYVCRKKKSPPIGATSE